MKYVSKHLGEGAGATSQMLIQTPDDLDFGTVLTPEAMLAHLDVLKTASKIVVEVDDTTWDLKDICYAQTIPMSENQILDSVRTHLDYVTQPCDIKRMTI